MTVLSTTNNVVSTAMYRENDCKFITWKCNPLVFTKRKPLL